MTAAGFDVLLGAARPEGPELTRLAAEATAKGEGRARALARFCQGLDDQLLWSGRLAELLRRLARGAWQVGEVTPLGARRVRVGPVSVHADDVVARLRG